ncbi:hypothetical protein LIER_42507 [Lithospermum erythrorhizon]|uniref:Transposase n=1 Tax=Lithospermum erythrorhizon TaxID=34254 RepID=A0AAV3RW42_LITER
MMWKQWKYYVKKEYYIPHKNDNEYLSKSPDDHKANKNAQIVKQRKYPHRSGRLRFHILIDELMKKNLDTSLLDIFLASRRMGKDIQDDATALICGLIEKELQKRPELERTKNFKNELFANAIGLERNGRVICMGRGVTLAKFRASSSSKSVLKKIANQQDDVQKQIEELNHEKEELKEYKDELSNVRTDMMDYFEFKKKKNWINIRRKLRKK